METAADAPPSPPPPSPPSGPAASILPISPQRRLDAILRNDFMSFTRKAFAELSPGQQLHDAWYLEAISHALERCVQGKCRRLIISVPPRHLKSVMASVALPAYLLGRDPKARIVCASYSAELAGKQARDCRAIISSQWYKRLFPQTRIGGFRNAEHDYVTSKRGFRLSTSVGGTLTGRGGNWVIIDDPMKPDDAQSEVRRKNANEWFDNTLYTRLDDKSTGVIIVVMQRLHIDDLVGHLLAKGETFEVLSLPAIAEVDEQIPLGRGRIHHRKAGDLLSPGREGHAILADLKETLGTYNFSAQYQQNPIPADGEIFKQDWLRFYDVPPKSGGYFVQSWDTAMKDSELNDYSVCTTWYVHNQLYYLIDIFRARLKFPALAEAFLNLRVKWACSQQLIEDKGSGISLGQIMKGRGIGGLHMIEPVGDKVMRAYAQSAPVESGKVLLPREAPWLSAFRTELLQFPSGAHDDQVDSVTQFLAWMERPNMRAYRVKLGGI